MKNTSAFILAIASGIFWVPASAQTPVNPMEEIEMQYESQSDPYLPNEFNDQHTSPAYTYRSPDSAQSSFSSTVTTVQVNINSSGQNILGDAANETSIAINPANPNAIAIGWRQFNNVSSSFRQAGYAYSANAGASWTFPGCIQPGIFRTDPVLDYDLNGKILYNSLTNSPDYYCKVFESTNGGASWNSGTAAQGGDKQWMAVDRTSGIGSGNIYSSWTGSVNASSCDPGFFTRSTNGNVSYEPCITVKGYPWWGSMTVGINGELFIGAGTSYYLDSLLFVKSLNAQIPNSTIVWDSVNVYMDGKITYNVPINPAGMVGQINIDVDRSTGPGQGNIYMLASLLRISNSDPSDVMFVKSTDGGLTWSLPLRVNDDVSATHNQWHATMSVAPNGRIDAVWLDTRDAPSNSDTSALYYSYSIDEGNTWSVNERLSATFNPHLGYPSQQKMGDYIDMQSDNTGAHLAWCATFNGEENAYYSHIVPGILTGLDPILQHASFTVYPNPTDGMLNVSGIEKQVNVEIYNPLGEKVYTGVLAKTRSEIDISSLPSGIYFLKVICPNGSSAVRKIIKK